jgi:hypothetical protein
VGAECRFSEYPSRWYISAVFNLGYTYPRGCAKTSCGESKIEIKEYYIVINTEKSGPDLGLTTGDPGLNYTPTTPTKEVEYYWYI